MLVKKIVQLIVLSLAVLWNYRCDAASTSRRVLKLCGRDLSEYISTVCHVYNSPSWDVPTVVEQPAVVARRKRRTGIADECCVYGCTQEQLHSYCAISVKTDSPLESIEAHMIADRSAEVEAAAKAEAAMIPPAVSADRREVGRRSRGYGRARRRRCRCRRTGRRRSALMGNMDIIRSVERAAPVLGTVSPLLTWGRTLNTDFPNFNKDRYAYIAVYTS